MKTKETKTFFTNHNKLNKGYSRTPKHKIISHKKSDILPDIALLEEYEAISPGITNKIIDMANKEQKHKHEIDCLNAENRRKIAILSQIIMALLVLIVSASTFGIALVNDKLFALGFAAIGFTSILTIYSSFVKKLKDIN